ncbi:MAG: hypothetical protein IPP71_02915 [Bacteroidetes bacterium]|nr:hypothetical protein [Bacteroidota bacterium]
MKSIFTIILFFCIFSTNTYSQWSKLPGPYGGVFSDIERVGNEIWLSSISGLYTSQNEGLTWQKSTLIPQYCHDVIAFNDTIVILYSVPSTFNVLNKSISSFDGGLSWHQPVLISNGAITGAKLQKSSKVLFYEGTGGKKQSSDGGLTWTTLSLNFSLLFSNGNMALGFVSSSENYYFSIDGNSPWNLIYSAYSGTTLKILNDCFFITDYDTVIQSCKLMKSCDLGNTWTVSMLSPSQISSSALISLNDTLYFYLSSSSAMMSVDNGDTWVPGTWPNWNLIYPGVFTTNGNRVILDNRKDVYTFVPSQGILIRTNTGTSCHIILSLISNKGVLFASTYYDYFKSIDGGQSWELQLNTGVQDTWVSGDTIYGINFNFNGEIVLSYDNGTTWNTKSIPFGTSSPGNRFGIAKLDSKIYIGYGQRIISSSDEGTTWDTLPPLPNITVGTCFVNNVVGGIINSCFNKIYALSTNGYVFRFNDQLQIWEMQSSLCTSSNNEDDRLFTIGNKLLAEFGNDLYISADSGMTWTMSSGLSPKSIMEYNGTWFGVLGINEILYSNDEGGSWNQLDTDSSFSAYRNLTILNGVFYADGFYDGIYRRNNPLFTLSGNVYHDINNDGIRNNGEPGLQQLMVATTPAGIGSTINSAGDYNLVTDMPGIINAVAPTQFMSVNPSSYSFSGETDSLDFGVYLPPNIYDLKADITNTNVFNPGFSTNIQLTVKNYGNYSANPQAKLLLDTNLLFINSTPSPTYYSNDTAVWNLSPLNLLDQTTILVEVQTKLQTPNGSFVTAQMEAWPVAGDTLPFDNYASLRGEVVGSYDPNDKTCLQGNIFTPSELQSNAPLEYVIRFQNQGTFPTAFVVITDTLSSLLDFTTFRMVSSSHPCTWSLSGLGVLVITFNPLHCQLKQLIR